MFWIPACAGMTGTEDVRFLQKQESNIHSFLSLEK